MNGLVLSGATRHVLSGAGLSCYQAQRSSLTHSGHSDFSALNLTTNSESYGFSNNKDNGAMLGKTPPLRQFPSRSANPSTPPMTAGCSRQLRMTRVALLDLPARIKVTLRFGIPHSERRYNCARSEAIFTPHALFCRVHWEISASGLPRWQLLVLQAGNGQEAVQRIPGIDPGAVLLLEVSGTTAVQRVLRVLAEIEARSISLADVSPAYWRTLHNRLVARKRLPVYTFARHESYLLTRADRFR
jgi:hypothetical protein